jgi:hypothetical protein
LPSLLFASYFLIAIGWFFGNPPGASPDEPAHFYRALTLVDGQVVGGQVDERNPQLRQWQDGLSIGMAARVTVPKGFFSPSLACNIGRLEMSADCLRQVTPSENPVQAAISAGKAQPFPYLIPGLLARLADDPIAALLLGRAGSAAIALLLLGLSVALVLRNEGAAWLVSGLVVAATPMVLFLAASLSPSGPEIAAGICFFTALLHVTTREKHRRLVWIALGVSGAVLAASRSLGPLWILLGLGLLLGVLGIRKTVLSLRSAGWAGLVAGVAVTVAMGLNVFWALRFPTPGRITIQQVQRSLLGSFSAIPSLFSEQVGVFSWLDLRLSSWLYVSWFLLLLTLLVVAFVVGTARQRWLLALLTLGAEGVTVVLTSVFASIPARFQGRYTLPLLVAVPLFAGHIIRENRDRFRLVRSAVLPLTLVSVAAVVQVCAWYLNARRHAVGLSGPFIFVGDSEWIPLGGWMPWILAVTVGALGVIVCTALLGRERRNAGVG